MCRWRHKIRKIAVEILQSVNNRTQSLREIAYYAWLLLTYLPVLRRPQGLVVIGVCLSVCLSVCLCVCVSVCLCVRTLFVRKISLNGFMDHHQIWWVGAGGEPLEQVQFWC